MEILSWNIQAAKGVDNIVSTERITSDIRAFSDPDVICLQEILRTPEHDQVADLSQAFPDYECVFGAAINRLYPSGRLEFGNMILTRLPILQITQHKLPQPAEPEQKHMPRQAIELLLVNQNEFLRVTTLHLDYFAAGQRSAQVGYLAGHHQECLARFRSPSPEGGEEQFASMPETARSIYCGDFNLTVDTDDYKTMLKGGCNNNTHGNENQNSASDNASAESGLIDCWRHVHGSATHDPTCGIFDREQWPEGPHCRDFFFASTDVAENVTAMEVETNTAASDHQPLKIKL